MIWFRCASFFWRPSFFYEDKFRPLSLKVGEDYPTSFWVPNWLTPSTVHLIKAGGFDSSLEHWRVTSEPICAVSGPLMWTRSPETETEKTFKYCNSAQLSPASAIFLVFSFQLNQPTALFRQDLLARNDLNGWVLINLKLNNRDIWIFK